VTASDDWFVTRQVLPAVWMINEPGHVCTWLVAGRDRAFVLDSGLGVRPIRPVAEALCGLPVELVTTHYHFDHVGGHQEFDELAIHEAGVAPLVAGTPAEILRGYAAFVADRDRQLEVFRKLDEAYFDLLTVETLPRPFPADFDPARWSIPPARATSALRDGDVLDLGGRSLTVLHTPGHSPDGIALLDERDGLLFAVDQFNIGPVYAHFPDSDVAELARSVRTLADLGDAVRLIFAHHYGRVIAEPNLLGEFADFAERVAVGDELLAPAEDIVGNEILAARADRFSLTVPGPSPAAQMHNPIR
jgi:glyoxylase-like metal-dependent hydrolase (beta-lactamase superfamily II)